MRTGIAFGMTVALVGCSDHQPERARTQVKRWVEKLDGDTTPTGEYKRFAGDRLPEVDPWGNKLYVQYEQGGVAEVVKVRSAGAGGEPFSSDDVVEERMATNLKGLSHSAGKVAGDVAREAAKGTIEGIKEGFSRKKNDEIRNDEKRDE